MRTALGYNRYMDIMDMLRSAWLGAPAEFESAYGLEESIVRLSDATGREAFCLVGREEAVGTVTKTGVSLRREIPMFGNPFKPFFTGKFSERGGKVFLCGYFSMHMFAKVGISAWFAFLFFILMLGAVSGTAALALFGGGMLMMSAGAAIVMLGKWFARNDAQWLSAVICRTLGAKPVELPATTVTGDEHGPLSLTLFILMIALFGMVTLIAGRNSGRDYVFGVLLIFFAWGAWRRMMIFWAVGLALFSCAAAAALSTIPHRMAQMGDAQPALVVLLDVAAVLISAWWTYWWYIQKHHFRD
jgi:hypothetical protein